MRSVYFDYNATTPLDPGVLDAMLPYLGGIFGNPSSIHHVGQKARVALDDSRDRLATVWGCKPSEVIFTSGGTESNNLAILGVARLKKASGNHIVTTAIEHHSVFHTCQYLARKEDVSVSFIRAKSDGAVDPDEVCRAIRPETVLVTVMSANNETGALQPVAEIGKYCRQKGIVFHCDASQSFGKESFNSIHQFEADLVTLCAHKFHGPKGAGALYARSVLLLDAILFGGGHENERRAGTENLPAIAGLTAAAERFVREPVFPTERLRAFTDRLETAARQVPGVTIQGVGGKRLSNTVAFSVQGCDSISLMAGFDLEGICASSGSACSAGSLEPSHVLLGMGVNPKEANSFVRFSLGRENTEDEVQYVSARMEPVIRRARGES